MKKYRITSKIRFTVFAVIVALCIFTWISTIAGNNIASSSSMTQYQCVEIESGDTLWSIAKEYKPDNKDVRQVVYDICEANDMSAEDLNVGQKIIIPVYQ